jgi:hypothetical protein
MAPVSVMGTLTQVLAEVLAGVAYSQLIRPGAPVIFGAFVTSIDMNSGAPTFGTPEAQQITNGAGQLARRLGLPYRSGGAFNGSKLPDAQAAYESANSLQNALLSGVNFMLHACGWLEGGLVSSPEKFVLDADQLGILHKFAQGVPPTRTRRPWTRCARWGRGAISWAAPIPRRIIRMRSGAAGARLPAVRDLGRGWRQEQLGAGRRPGAEASGRLPGADARPGHRRGAARLHGPAQGRDARRLHLRLRHRRTAPHASARSSPGHDGSANSRGRRRDGRG